MAAKKKAEQLRDYHVVVVLDRSGSMDSVRQATISGFNEYIGGLKKTDGDATFTLATFSDQNNKAEIKYVYDGVLIKDVAELTQESYVPNGGTPLYDSLASVIKKIEADYSAKKKKPSILVMTMTDGEENASKEYSRDTVFKLITDKEKDDWKFGYLGANQDAWAVAHSIGIKKGNAKNYATADMVETFKAVSLVTSDARRAHPAQVLWQGEEVDDDKP